MLCRGFRLRRTSGRYFRRRLVEEWVWGLVCGGEGGGGNWQEGFTEEVSIEEGLEDIGTGVGEDEVEEEGDVGVSAVWWEGEGGWGCDGEGGLASWGEEADFGEVVAAAAPVVTDGEAWEGDWGGGDVDGVEDAHEAEFVTDFEADILAQDFVEEFDGVGGVGCGGHWGGWGVEWA